MIMLLTMILLLLHIVLCDLGETQVPCQIFSGELNGDGFIRLVAIVRLHQSH